MTKWHWKLLWISIGWSFRNSILLTHAQRMEAAEELVDLIEDLVAEEQAELAFLKNESHRTEYS